MDTNASAVPQSLKRRALVKGAAWATPALAVSPPAAPAVAASSECSPQSAESIQASFAFTPTTNNAVITNWTQTRSSGAPKVRFSSHANGVASAAFLQDDPGAAEATTTTLISPTACLGPGTHTFTFNSSLYHANARNVSLTANVVTGTASTVLGNTISFETTSGDQTLRPNDTVTGTVSERTQVQFRYRWVVRAGATSGNARFGDDIGVTAPRVRKTAWPRGVPPARSASSLLTSRSR